MMEHDESVNPIDQALRDLMAANPDFFGDLDGVSKKTPQPRATITVKSSALSGKGTILDGIIYALTDATIAAVVKERTAVRVAASDRLRAAVAHDPALAELALALDDAFSFEMTAGRDLAAKVGFGLRDTQGEGFKSAGQWLERALVSADIPATVHEGG